LRRFTYSSLAPLYVVGKFLISTEKKLICFPRKEEQYQRDAYSFISRVLSKQHQLAELEREEIMGGEIQAPNILYTGSS